MSEAVEQALRHWQSRGAKKAGEPFGPSEPTIAISRQAGANGPAIARAVGQRLGWPVYDRELLKLIGSEMGLRTQLVESVDERTSNWLKRCCRQVFGSEAAITEEDYVKQLVQVLFSLAAHGGCVFLGRGAAQVLPKETTLRVRLVGPKAKRVAALVERFDLTADEATHWIDETDNRRDRFVRDKFRREPNDAALYDLVLNSSRLSVADCTELIVDALERVRDRMTPPLHHAAHEPLVAVAAGHG
jgi:cytidylate kinase